MCRDRQSNANAIEFVMHCFSLSCEKSGLALLTGCTAGDFHFVVEKLGLRPVIARRHHEGPSVPAASWLPCPRRSLVLDVDRQPAVGVRVSSLGRHREL